MYEVVLLLHLVNTTERINIVFFLSFSSFIYVGVQQCILRGHLLEVGVLEETKIFYVKTIVFQCKGVSKFH